MYELFSIMIHSGSAVGGHYYAYIKLVSVYSLGLHQVSTSIFYWFTSN